MAFALCLPQISLSGENAINDLVARMATKSIKRPLIVTEKALLDLGLRNNFV